MTKNKDDVADITEKIIGRRREQELLRDLIESNKSEWT